MIEAREEADWWHTSAITAELRNQSLLLDWRLIQVNTAKGKPKPPRLVEAEDMHPYASGRKKARQREQQSIIDMFASWI